jgi:hypothetical protein
MVYAVPEAQLEEYRDHIFERYAIKLSEGQLSRFLKENDITHKKVSSSI